MQPFGSLFHNCDQIWENMHSSYIHLILSVWRSIKATVNGMATELENRGIVVLQSSGGFRGGSMEPPFWLQ